MIELVPSMLSMIPSPSASVVVSVDTVPGGGAPSSTPPPMLARMFTAGAPCSRSEGSRPALTDGTLLRVVRR